MTTEWNTGTFKIGFDDRGRLDALISYRSERWVLNQMIIVRTADAVSDPFLLYRFERIEHSQNAVSYRVTGDDGEWQARLIIENKNKRLRFHLQVEGRMPVWMVEWKLGGLDFKEVLVPALGGRAISVNLPEGYSESYKYPFWWNAQFAIGITENGGIMLRSEDEGTRLKLLRVGRENETFSMSYGFEAKAPLKAHSLEFEWFLEGFEGNWQSAVDRHAAWLEQKGNMPLPGQRKNYPDWAAKINFILEIWGAHRQSVHPSHSFEQMLERIEQFALLHDPVRTLLYLPGFAENGIDSHAPDYHPSEQCGGPQKFGELIQRAHDLGYRVMIHTNVLALTYAHRLYPELKKYTVIDAFDRPQGWAMDIDGDWLGEPFFAYMNPAALEWGDLMKETLGALIREYKLDAVFLDQTLLAFNVSNGPDFMQGMVDHIRSLQTAFPNVMFAGEGIAEHTAKVLPFAQIHGIDGLPGVHGADEEKHWISAHSVLMYLFSRYTRMTAHLLTRHPSHYDFERQEKIYAALGVMPALCLYNYRQDLDSPALRRMLKRANEFKI